MGESNSCVNILIIFFIIGILYYLLYYDTEKDQQIKQLKDKNDLEFFDQELLDNVITDEPTQRREDYIKEWDDTFNKCKSKTKSKQKSKPNAKNNSKSLNVLTDTNYDDKEDFAQFTSQGINYNNNLTQFNSADLLPSKDTVATTDIGWEYKDKDGWSESNPQIKEIQGNSWLKGDRFMGMYTVSSSLRNASHDIRCEPANPQMAVSPWNMSTILPSSVCKDDCSI
jgi:hypothetical protein